MDMPRSQSTAFHPCHTAFAVNLAEKTWGEEKGGDGGCRFCTTSDAAVTRHRYIPLAVLFAAPVAIGTVSVTTSPSRWTPGPAVVSGWLIRPRNRLILVPPSLTAAASVKPSERSADPRKAPAGGYIFRTAMLFILSVCRHYAGPDSWDRRPQGYLTRPSLSNPRQFY
ncbi:hypothetical protein EJ06DRAFT_430836 [Trichodelitschia bisporula]|uniref:Uncharacterized protein n=1 Tax=Trichodelitschia bisporula TaxID=703511 RepID=A0A6G1HX00_9PEZI|nr:hypothetical protein EJ06DRAFT_430836 [Trichodelitschia bisporula]